MRFLEVAKDGGPESPVTGFFVIEIKSLFSIVFLKFNKGMRESFHDHAFNALTLWLKGTAIEYVHNKAFKNVVSRIWKSPTLKYTPRWLMHRIEAPQDVYAFSLRGPWSKTWKEYNPSTGLTTTLKNNREVISIEEEQ